MNTDLQPREASGGVKDGSGPKYGGAVNAEPARKVKELPKRSAPSIVGGSHNV